MLNRKPRILILSVAFIAILSNTALALDMEYYTYNGFDPIVAAFQKMALIFGDTTYQSLFFVVMVTAIMFGCLMMVMKATLGGKFSVAGWLVPMGMGFLICASLIVPKGNLWVYDPVKNRNQQIGDIPDGVVLVAGMLNKIERSFVDMIYTSGDPEDYHSQAGGVGFDMVFNLGNKGVLLTDKNIHASLMSYINDCVFFEVQRPGGAITVNQLANNTDFTAIFANANNPAIYTSYYTDSGETDVTCQTAWRSLQAQMSNAATFSDSIKAKCAEAGFDPTNPDEFTQCQDTLANTVNWLEGATYEASDIHRQMFMGQTLNDALLGASPDTAMTVLASRNTGTSLLGSGMFANQWLPIIRAVITAVAIGLIPFLVIFIPTPLAGKAISVCCGLFIWITAWGVTDAIVHSMAMDMGAKALYEVTQNQLGLSAIVNFSTGGMKALAVFGAVRWAGVMLATVITGMLVKLGGSAMAQLSGQLTSTASSQGQQAAMTTMTPEGKARELSALEMAPSTMANAHKFSYADRTNVATAERFGKTMGGRMVMNEFGGVEGAAAMIAAGQAGHAYKFSQSWNTATRMPGGVSTQYGREIMMNQADRLADMKTLEMSGNNVEALAESKAAQLRGNIAGAGGLQNYNNLLRERGEANEAGQIDAALMRSGYTGESFEDAYKNNIKDAYTKEAVKNAATHEMVGKYGFGRLTDAENISQSWNVLSAEAKQEVAKRLGTSVDDVQKTMAGIEARQRYFNDTSVDKLATELGHGNKEAGYRSLAEYTLANTRSDSRTYGSPESMVQALTLMKNKSYGEALGHLETANMYGMSVRGFEKELSSMGSNLSYNEKLGIYQAAKEINMNPGELSKLTSNLGVQGTIGVAQAINEGYLTKQDLRDAAFMHKVGQFFTEAQMMASGRTGDVKIPRSLYNNDGNMDPRMKQLWISANAETLEKIVQLRGIGRTSLTMGGETGLPGGSRSPGTASNVSFGGMFGDEKQTTHDYIRARLLELTDRASTMRPDREALTLLVKHKLFIKTWEEKHI